MYAGAHDGLARSRPRGSSISGRPCSLAVTPVPKQRRPNGSEGGDSSWHRIGAMWKRTIRPSVLHEPRPVGLQSGAGWENSFFWHQA